MRVRIAEPFADSLHYWVIVDEHMAAALKAKGYEYRYISAEASGHTGGAVINQTFPGVLEWLGQSYTSRDS